MRDSCGAACDAREIAHRGAPLNSDSLLFVYKIRNFEAEVALRKWPRRMGSHRERGRRWNSERP